MTIENRILSEVSAYARVPRSVILSNSRKGEVVALRALAIKCMISKGVQLATIGRFFGHKDHTSAMNARDNSYPTDEAIPMILERVNDRPQLKASKALSKQHFSVSI